MNLANPSADEVAEFLAEIEMLKGVGTHSNVVCFLGCCTIRAPYLMIMEYVGRGNLVKLMAHFHRILKNVHLLLAKLFACSASGIRTVKVT